MAAATSTSQESQNTTVLRVLQKEVQNCKEQSDIRWCAHLREQELLERFTEQFREEMSKRLETMNEFRAALKDQAGQFFTRVEHDAYQKLVESDLRALRESRAELLGKASQSSANWAFALAFVATAIGLVSLVLRLVKS